MTLAPPVPRSRAPYLDLIEADRAGEARERGPRRQAAPLAVKKGTAHRRQLERDLGRHYEQCKKDNRGRFHGQRLKGYCAATAWTIVEGRRTAPNRKGVTMRRRNSKGRFIKGGERRRPKSGSPRRRRARAREHNVRGYTMKRAGRRIRVRRHRSAEMYAPRRRRARAHAPRRRRSRPRTQTNIIVARAHRRRRYYAKAPPMATAGGLVIAGIGATVGYLVTDLGDRYIAGYNPTTSPAPTLPSGVTSIAQFNDVVVSAKPSLARIGWGLGMMIVGFGGGAMAPWAGLKMFLYGWGLGATAHLGGQLLNAYVVEPMFQTNGVASANGSRMFQHEIHSNNTLTPPAGAAAGTLTGLGQTPGARMTAGGTPIAALGPGGARGSLGAQPHARIPSALASRRGGLGQVAPLNFSQQAYDQIAATQNSGSGFIPGVQEGQPPPGSSPPSSTSPPPSTSPPSTTQPPGTAPPSRTQPPGCGPCELPSPCACSGTAQCVCGNCPGPNISGMGQPPDDRRDPYRHPLFRAMNQPRSSLFRRAA